MKLYIKNISDVTENDKSRYYRLLDDEKKAEYNNSDNQSRKLSILAGTGFAKEKLSDELNIPAEKIHFRYTENRKPMLSGNKKMYFNISHSGDYIVVATNQKPIGVDIERIRLYNDKLAKRVCDENELQFIESSDAKDRAFTVIWTRKESFLKAKGSGIYTDLKQYCLVSDNELLKKKYGIDSFITNTEIENYIISVCLLKS